MSGAEALQRRGLAAARQGRAAEAEALFAAAVAADPASAAALYDHGIALASLGRRAEAVASYDAALALRPDHPETWNNRGVALFGLGRFAEAIASYDRALALRPGYAAALANRGNAELASGDAAAALASCDAALAAQPDHGRALHLRTAALTALGNARFALGESEAALAAYDAALAAAPARADLHYLRGNALHRLRRDPEALAAYDAALTRQANFPEALNNRGNALLALDRTAEALASFEAALARRPAYPEALNNAAVALRDLGRPAESLAAADRAVALRPNYAEALLNRGNALLSLCRLEEAIAAFDQAIAVAPAAGAAPFNRSLALLLGGDFARGWGAYESRWQASGLIGHQRSFTQPLWDGEADIEGRTLLLHAEQGNGDTLQFCRYATLAAARGARVVLEVPKLLAPLMASLSGPAQVLTKGEAPPDFDLHCPLLTLPRAFGTRLETIPATVPYLAPPAERVAQWRARLGPRRRPRLGLAWSGSLSHKNDRNRSVRLDMLGPVMELPVDLYCLQRELRVWDVPAFAPVQQRLAHFGRALGDFADTAALAAEMDLIVAVDTAVAHLAGALGREVWVLLPHSPDWRWLLGRDDSPWYPTMRLFRQRRPNDWSDPLGEVFTRLRERFPGG